MEKETQFDATQNFDIRLTDIVPEYYRSKCIRAIFLERLKIAASYLKEMNVKSLLDAGCGDGSFLSEAMRFAELETAEGVDYNVHVEELNGRHGNIRFTRANLLQKLPFDRKFDAVACLDVLEHFEDADQVLKNIIPVLKIDGFLIVSGPVESFLYKLGRLVTKGTFSMETGPGAGKHYYNIIQLDALIRKRFAFVRRTKVKFMFIRLFDVNLYQLKKIMIQ
jgi:2-polyprenyl-3-methyl-5-hydroxy-6-metoxy-1,4-benzoquinol methylase